MKRGRYNDDDSQFHLERLLLDGEVERAERVDGEVAAVVQVAQVLHERVHRHLTTHVLTTKRATFNVYLYLYKLQYLLKNTSETEVIFSQQQKIYKT